MAGIRVQVDGVPRLLARLKQREMQMGRGARRGGVSALVGFAQDYAIFVHEKTGVYHAVGQAKFLEKPARYLNKEIVRIIKNALLAGMTLARAVILAGLRLQREAQTLTPVDTGALRASAYTRLE